MPPSPTVRSQPRVDMAASEMWPGNSSRYQETRSSADTHASARFLISMHAMSNNQSRNTSITNDAVDTASAPSRSAQHALPKARSEAVDPFDSPYYKRIRDPELPRPQPRPPPPSQAFPPVQLLPPRSPLLREQLAPDYWSQQAQKPRRRSSSSSRRRSRIRPQSATGFWVGTPTFASPARRHERLEELGYAPLHSEETEDLNGDEGILGLQGNDEQAAANTMERETSAPVCPAGPRLQPVDTTNCDRALLPPPIPLSHPMLEPQMEGIQMVSGQTP